MVDYQYNLKAKSDAELHEWIAMQKQRSAKYIAGIQEILDRNEAFVRERELITIGIAILVLGVTIIIIV